MVRYAIILIGPPGSGKGTQAEMLAERLGFFHWSSSNTVKHWMTKHPDHPLVKKSMENYAKGGLFEPELMAHVVEQESEQILKKHKGIIYDGSPRTLPELHEAWPFWKKTFGKNNILVINLKLELENAQERLTKRLICEFDHPYIRGEGGLVVGSICPKDGTKLKLRDLDNPEVIKVRFEEFKKQTIPTLEFLRHQTSVLDVDASKAIAKVFEDVINKLTPHLKALKNAKNKKT
ncbi:nucleoside monophosphate kinase [Candidatus Parcubacteria bacterium]|nr:MAG: nucleoside monophosphate kinase [Candidatus Parcubacteria bacterium]